MFSCNRFSNRVIQLKLMCHGKVLWKRYYHAIIYFSCLFFFHDIRFTDYFSLYMTCHSSFLYTPVICRKEIFRYHFSCRRVYVILCKTQNHHLPISEAIGCTEYRVKFSNSHQTVQNEQYKSTECAVLLP